MTLLSNAARTCTGRCRHDRGRIARESSISARDVTLPLPVVCQLMLGADVIHALCAILVVHGSMASLWTGGDIECCISSTGALELLEFF